MSEETECPFFEDCKIDYLSNKSNDQVGNFFCNIKNDLKKYTGCGIYREKWREVMERA